MREAPGRADPGELRLEMVAIPPPPTRVVTMAVVPVQAELVRALDLSVVRAVAVAARSGTTTTAVPASP